MQNLENLDWNQILEHLSSYATSAQGKEQLISMAPLSNSQSAQDSFNIIQEVITLLRQGERPFMESLDFFHTWSQRLEKQSVLKPIELKDARLFFIESQALLDVVRPSEAEWSHKLREEYMEVKGPLSAIEHLITPQAEIRMDASEHLYKLNQEKQSTAQKIQNTLTRVVKSHEHENALQDKFVTNREGRWVVPVKSGMKGEMPGIVHAKSNTKQTLFMEPQEVVPLNNKLKQIEADIEAEIEKLLREISDYLHTLYNEIIISKDLLLKADVRFAQAQFCDALDANPVEFSEEVELKELRHPVMVINAEKIIPNNLKLSRKERILLLSGPNAGGKTVLLKSFGLAAQMARCGLLACTDKNSKLPFFEEILTAVGDSQSVDSQLSTFVGHLKTLNQACSLSGHNSLILVDEICGSTDPEEGAALARAFIEHYSGEQVYSLITSHLGPLKSGWNNNSGIINGSMEYDKESGTSTYHFIKGIPGQSLAFSSAKRIGILESVYKKAQNFLSPETREKFAQFDEIEKAKESVVGLRQELQEEKKRLGNETQKYQKLLLEFEQERDQKIKKEVELIRAKLVEESKKKNIDKVFTAHERRSKIQVDFPQVVKFTGSKSSSEDLTLDSFKKSFPPGSKVYVPTLKQDAIVQSAPNKSGSVEILAGSMRLSLDWNDLKPPKKAVNPIAKRSNTNNIMVELADRGDSLDVRGQKVDSAISELELFLDSALGKRYDRVKIIHGHGSESLKKAIRSHLSRSIYVTRWASAQASLGDDGTTYAYLALD